MGLRDIVIPTTEIKTPGGSFSVRGVSFDDLTQVSLTHGPQLALVFGQIQSGAKIEGDQVRNLLQQLGPQVPELVSAIIALAADDYTPEGIQQVKKLNFQYQIEALEAIFHLTFTSEAELKKFGESILRMVTGATTLLSQMRLPLSEAGFGESADK